MSVKLTVRRLSRNLTDGSEVFNLVLDENLTELNEANRIIINCQDEAHQDRLLNELLIAGFALK